MLQDGLREIAATHPQVTDVRGLGLMVALELKTAEHAAQLVQRAFERGLLLLTAGARAVRIMPAAGRGSTKRPRPAWRSSPQLSIRRSAKQPGETLAQEPLRKAVD